MRPVAYWMTIKCMSEMSSIKRIILQISNQENGERENSYKKTGINNNNKYEISIKVEIEI